MIGGGAGIVFKGSGFYITDYKGIKPAASSSPKKETKKEQKPPEKSSSETKKD